MQSLFEWDFGGCHDEALPGIVKKNINEFGPGLSDSDFVYRLVNGVVSERSRLDDIIVKAAPDWPIENIAAVDRNILRLGLYELLYIDKSEVPARVAINEAIELAKTFGGEKSGKFVNGVLGAVYKEMGEPGKHDVPAKKKRIKDVPYEDMPIEQLAGGVVFHKDAATGAVTLAFVHDIFGYWTLSKGHTKENEAPQAGAIREIKEELGLTVTLAGELGSNEYIASDPEKGKIRKVVTYYLLEAAHPNELTLGEKSGLDDAAWFTLAQIPDLKIYDDIVPFITKGITLIHGR